MTKQLTDGLLAEFIDTFLGYGNYCGRYWLIGMEEGGGNSVEEIEQRLIAWAARGKPTLEDLPEIAGPDHRFFKLRAALQPTWSKLIRVILSSQGDPPTAQQVREYQRTKLGKRDGDNCLIELLPLPSPSLGHWLYGELSALDFLHTREDYHSACLEPRIERLKKLVAEHHPQVVIFYGLRYSPHWDQIADVEFKNEGDIHIGSSDATIFIVMKHPTAKGVSNAYLHAVGQAIASRRAAR